MSLETVLSTENLLGVIVVLTGILNWQNKHLKKAFTEVKDVFTDLKESFVELKDAFKLQMITFKVVL